MCHPFCKFLSFIVCAILLIWLGHVQNSQSLVCSVGGLVFPTHHLSKLSPPLNQNYYIIFCFCQDSCLLERKEVKNFLCDLSAAYYSGVEVYYSLGSGSYQAIPSTGSVGDPAPDSMGSTLSFPHGTTWWPHHALWRSTWFLTCRLYLDPGVH